MTFRVAFVGGGRREETLIPGIGKKGKGIIMGIGDHHIAGPKADPRRAAPWPLLVNLEIIIFTRLCFSPLFFFLFNLFFVLLVLLN